MQRPMDRQELITFFRGQIDRLKEQGVPALMQEGASEKLLEVLKGVDFGPFEKENDPEFTLEELQLEDPDDVKATVFYVWGNPFLPRGDVSFFRSWGKFTDLIKSTCQEWGSKLYDLLVYGFVLSNVKELCKREKGCEPALSIEALLHPEILLSQRGSFVSHALEQIKELKSQSVPALMRVGDVSKLNEIIQGIDYSAYEANPCPEFDDDEFPLESATGEDALATALYIWANPHLIDGDYFFFSCAGYIDELLAKEFSLLGKRLYKMVYDDYVLSRKVVSKDLVGRCKPIETLEQLLGLEKVEGEEEYTRSETIEEFAVRRQKEDVEGK